MAEQGKGTVLPTQTPRQTGATGHVNIGGVVHQGTNLPGGRVRTADGKIHGGS